MIADIGLIALLLGFLLSTYATAASAYSGRQGRPLFAESARNAVLGAFGLLTLAVLSLVYSLVSLDFSRAYVVDVSSRAMSPFLRATADPRSAGCRMVRAANHRLFCRSVRRASAG